MKFIISLAPTRLSHGIASSLNCIEGIEVIFWDPANKPVMDMFDEVKPNVILCYPEYLNLQEMEIAISRYPETGIVCLGDAPKGIRAHMATGASESPEVPSLGFVDGAMIAQVNRGEYDSKLKSEIMIFTDYIDLDAKKKEMIETLCNIYNVKIFGSKKINLVNYLGNVDLPTRSHAMASTDLYVDLGDNTWYDAATVGSSVAVLSEADISGVATFCDKDSMLKVVDKVLSDSDKKSKTKIARASVRSRTYFEPINEILLFFGLSDYSEQLKEIKRRLV